VTAGRPNHKLLANFKRWVQVWSSHDPKIGQELAKHAFMAFVESETQLRKCLIFRSLKMVRPAGLEPATF
jgi:hypothetical protein